MLRFRLCYLAKVSAESEAEAAYHQLLTTARWLFLTAMVSAAEEVEAVYRRLESCLDSRVEMDQERLRPEVRQFQTKRNTFPF